MNKKAQIIAIKAIAIAICAILLAAATLAMLIGWASARTAHPEIGLSMGGFTTAVVSTAAAVRILEK